MKKKTWGIILIVLGIAAIAGGLANGSLTDMVQNEPMVLAGFLAGAFVCFYYGFNLIRKGE